MELLLVERCEERHLAAFPLVAHRGVRFHTHLLTPHWTRRASDIISRFLFVLRYYTECGLHNQVFLCYWHLLFLIIQITLEVTLDSDGEQSRRLVRYFSKPGNVLLEIQSMGRLLWCAAVEMRTHCAADSSHCLSIKSPPPSWNRIKTQPGFVSSSLKALLPRI